MRLSCLSSLAAAGLLLIAVLCSCPVPTTAHSWLGCSDYRGDVNYYEDDKCKGYPRNWAKLRGPAMGTGYNLGLDTGMNHQGSVCQAPFNSPIEAGYTTAAPMAVYEQGGTYCLAWPTKNHVAAKCTNQYIPDTQMRIYRSNVNPTSDPSQAEFKQNEVTTNFGVHQNGQIDCLGFQRSPKFCENMDKALATGCISIPENLTVGTYVFQWFWIFNAGPDDSAYVTCWEAKVVPKGQGNGYGGVTGAANVADTLKDGASDTCKTKWAANGAVTPAPSGGGSSGSVSSSTGSAGPSSATGSGSGSTSSTGGSQPITSPELVAAVPGKFPIQIGPDPFDATVKYNTNQDSITITVDILGFKNNNWYGKGIATVSKGSGQVTIRVTPQNDITSVTDGIVLKAWSVPTPIFTSSAKPWEKELTAYVASVQLSTQVQYPNTIDGAAANWSLSIMIGFTTILLTIGLMQFY